jgi:hypothetical protein
LRESLARRGGEDKWREERDTSCSPFVMARRSAGHLGDELRLCKDWSQLNARTLEVGPNWMARTPAGHDIERTICFKPRFN